ncbi:MAG: glycosyltransferase family 2 protein [Clostridia bacterium]
MGEKIDILLATYNGEMYLKEQLDSILNQTYKNFNLIISDDASEDKTLQILKEYEKNDKRIKLFIQESNLGLIKNFEFLLTKVESKYYMTSDQDDVWLEDKIKLSFEKLILDDSDLVFTDLEIVDKNLNTIYPSMWKYLKVDKKIKKYSDYRILYLYNCVTGCTILAKSKFLENIIPLPNSKYLIHDYYMALVISLIGKITYLDKPTILYRQSGLNLVGVSKKSEKLNTFKEVRDLFIDIKVDHFNIFVQKEFLFSNEQKEFNKKCLVYYKKIKDTKYINFKGWHLFFSLYRYEKISYYLLNFTILNIPCLARFIFEIRKKLKN